ncbi:MAG: hypothetical protein HYR83_10270 [Planctomycetes bacterium]|nr:hypothetical protein [Planctomycetota bacterium]
MAVAIAVLQSLSLLSVAHAGNRDLILQALEEPGHITLDNVRLADAFQKVSEQTGVNVMMSDSAMRMTPQGPDTIIKKVDLARIPLREGLTRLLSPLGMTFTVRDNGVEVVPKPAILCLGRPPTWNELETLDELTNMHLGKDAGALGRLQSRIQFQVPLPDGWGALAEKIRDVGAGPGDEALTLACNNLGWSWCLNDKQIVVAPMEAQIRERLQKPITIRMNGRELLDVFDKLSDELGIRISAEPGIIASLPPQLRTIASLNVQQIPAERVLDRISEYTGLGYFIGSEGVTFCRNFSPGGIKQISSPVGDSPASPPVPAADPYVAKIVIPLSDGRTVEWLVRRSELPEDLRRMRERDLNDFIEQMRQRANEITKP